jgi:hypothetical protein
MMGASEPKSGEWSEPAEIAWDALVGLEVVVRARGARGKLSRVEVGPWKRGEPSGAGSGGGGAEAPRTE